jgi:hypothetical protein
MSSTIWQLGNTSITSYPPPLRVAFTTSQLRPISATHVPLSLDSGQVRFGGALLKKSKGRRWYGVRAWQKRHIELEENRAGWLETAKPLST